MVIRWIQYIESNWNSVYKKTTENELANEKARHYKTNERLNEVLLKLASYQEKYGIERIKQILPKNEKIENIVINETEEIIRR